MQEFRGSELPRMFVSTKLAYLMALIIYEIVAVAMYIPFQSETRGDILLNLAPNSLKRVIGAQAAKAVGITVLVRLALSNNTWHRICRLLKW